MPSSPTPGAVVRVERGEQELLVRPSPTPRRPAALEAQADALADRALKDGGELGELDHPLGRVLERREEELAARHVVVRVVDETAPAGDRQRQVGPGADDANRLRGVEPLREPAHPLALGLPVAQAGAVDEVLVVASVIPASWASASSGRGSRPRGSRWPAVVAERHVRLPELLRAAPAGAPSPPRVFSGPATRIQASISSRVRARSARSSRAAPPAPRSPRGCRTAPALVDVESRTSGHAPAARSGGRARRQRPRDRRRDDHHLPARLNVERALDEEAAYCSTRGSTKAPIRRSPGRPCRRARSGRRFGAP